MFHHRMLRMAFCVCLGFLMGAYLAKGFSQNDLQFSNPTLTSVKDSANAVATTAVVTTAEKSFFDTSLHLLRLKYDQSYRENYSFEEASNIISYIGESNLADNTLLSNVALSLGERAINEVYGDALANAAKSDAIVAERIQGFKTMCLDKGGYLLDEWDASQPMTLFEDQWVFKPIFWYKGTGLGLDSGVVCLKSL